MQPRWKSLLANNGLFVLMQLTNHEQQEIYVLYEPDISQLASF